MVIVLYSTKRTIEQDGKLDLWLIKHKHSFMLYTGRNEVASLITLLEILRLSELLYEWIYGITDLWC